MRSQYRRIGAWIRKEVNQACIEAYTKVDPLSKNANLDPPKIETDINHNENTLDMIRHNLRGIVKKKQWKNKFFRIELAQSFYNYSKFKLIFRLVVRSTGVSFLFHNKQRMQRSTQHC